MRAKAYTLLELLLTSVLFVGIAMLATGSFSQIIRTPLASQNYQQATAQVNGLLDEMERDLFATTKLPDKYKGKVWLYKLPSQEQNYTGSVETWPSNDVMVVPNGSDSSGEWHVYCTANPVEDGDSENVRYFERYVVPFKYDDTRYTLPVRWEIDDNDSDGVDVKLTLCDNLNNVGKLFNVGSTQDPLGDIVLDTPAITVESSNLSNPNLTVMSLKFTPIWFGSVNDKDDEQVVSPDAVRIEIAAQYYQEGSESRAEKNPGDISRPIVMRRLVNLKQNYAE